MNRIIGEWRSLAARLNGVQKAVGSSPTSPTNYHNSMDEEKRRAPRIKKALVVLYSSDIEGDQKRWNMTSIKNISEYGLCLAMSEHFSQGQVLLFQIKFPTRPFEWLKVEGKILAVETFKTKFDAQIADQSQARIEFIGISEEQKIHIREYVEWFIKQSGGEK
jgi:hypothetical protein